MTIFVTPLIMQANFSATPSIQPQRRGRPVVAPNSFPLLRNSSPVASSSSVGKGPLPTRVQYALLTPITSRICWGATPSPVQTPGRNGIGGGDIGEGAEIDIQHASLGSFRQDGLALGEFVVDKIFTIDDLELTHEIQRFEEFFFPFGEIFLEIQAVQQFLMFQPEFDVLGGKGFVQQVPYPKSIPAGLVHIGGADTFERASDLFLSL